MFPIATAIDVRYPVLRLSDFYDEFNRTDDAVVGGGWTDWSRDADTNASLSDNHVVLYDNKNGAAAQLYNTTLGNQSSSFITLRLNLTGTGDDNLYFLTKNGGVDVVDMGIDSAGDFNTACGVISIHTNTNYATIKVFSNYSENRYFLYYNDSRVCNASLNGQTTINKVLMYTSEPDLDYNVSIDYIRFGNPYNFTIFANDGVGNNLTTFNITINDTLYTTINGTINTTVPWYAGMRNITVNATGYTPYTNATYNITNNILTASLAPLPAPGALNVTITNPINDSILNNRTPELTYIYSSQTDLTANCTLYVNGTKHGTNLTVSNGTTTLIRVNASLPDNQYFMNISCIDTTTTTTSPDHNITIERNSPPIFLNITLPRNNTRFYDTTPTFTFNYSDRENLTLPCRLYLNDTLQRTNITTSNNTFTNLTTPTLTEYGDYIILLSCGETNKANITYNGTLAIYNKWAWIDTFNRADSGVVGNGWIESEAGSIMTNATIYNNTASLWDDSVTKGTTIINRGMSDIMNYSRIQFRYKVRELDGVTNEDDQYLSYYLNQGINTLLETQINQTNVTNPYYNMTGFSATSGYIVTTIDFDKTTNNYTLYINNTRIYEHPVSVWFTYTGFDLIAFTTTTDANKVNVSIDYVKIGEGYGELNVNLTNKTGGVISNFTANITHDYTSYTLQKSTTNETMRFNNLPNGTYTVTITPQSGYGTFTNKTDIYIGHTKNNTYTAPQSWVQLVFLNESDKASLSGVNISVDIFGVNQSFNGSTTTGTFNVTLPNDIYRIVYKPEGYATRNFFFKQETNQTNITLYTLHNNTATTISYSIFDETESYMQGVYVDVQKKFSDTNSFATVDMSKSNYAGGGTFTIDFDTAYRILIWENGEVIWQSAHANIPTTTIEIRVQTEPNPLEGIVEIYGVPVSLTFNNNSLIYTLTWNDATGLVRAGCLKIFKTSSMSGFELVNDTCLNNSVGSISINLTKYGNDSGHYLAEAWLDTNTNASWYPMSVLETIWGDTWLGRQGILLAIFLFGIIVFVSLSARNSQVTGFCIIGAILAINLLHLLPPLWTATMYLLVPIAILLIRRRD